MLCHPTQTAHPSRAQNLQLSLARRNESIMYPIGAGTDTYTASMWSHWSGSGLGAQRDADGGAVRRCQLVLLGVRLQLLLQPGHLLHNLLREAVSNEHDRQHHTGHAVLRLQCLSPAVQRHRPLFCRSEQPEERLAAFTTAAAWPKEM